MTPLLKTVLARLVKGAEGGDPEHTAPSRRGGAGAFEEEGPRRPNTPRNQGVHACGLGPLSQRPWHLWSVCA